MACGVPAMYLFHHFGSLLRWAPHTLFTHGSSLFPKPLGWNLADLSGSQNWSLSLFQNQVPLLINRQAQLDWLIKTWEVKKWKDNDAFEKLPHTDYFWAGQTASLLLWVHTSGSLVSHFLALRRTQVLLCIPFCFCVFFLLPSVQHVVWSKEFHLLAATRVTCSLNDLLWGKEKLSELCNTVQWCMRNLCQIQEGKENKNTAVLWNVSQD